MNPSTNWTTSAPTADEAWQALIGRVLSQGKEVRSRGFLCREILCSTTVVDMSRPIATSRPRLGYKFLAADAWFILTGKNDVASIAPYSPVISTFSDDGIRFDGAYGPRIVDQLRYACDTLDQDWGSRQSVIEIWRPNPRPSKDIPCTISAQWMIREESGGLYLHCFDTMRSSDAWLGWPYDVYTFSMLSAYIALVLRSRATKDSSLKNLKLGSLYLTAASQHLYINPKNDGASNIPYSIADTDESQRTAPQPYAPLDLGEFASPQEFVGYLATCKNHMAWEKKWMREFCSNRCTEVVGGKLCDAQKGHLGQHAADARNLP